MLFIRCCGRNYLQNSRHYFLTVPMVRNLALVYLGALGLHTVVEVSAGTEGWSLSRECVVITVIISRIQLLKDGWAEGLSSLLGAGQRPPSGPHHVGCSAVQHLTSPEWGLQQNKGKTEWDRRRSLVWSWELQPIIFAIIFYYHSSRGAHSLLFVVFNLTASSRLVDMRKRLYSF